MGRLAEGSSPSRPSNYRLLSFARRLEVRTPCSSSSCRRFSGDFDQGAYAGSVTLSREPLIATPSNPVPPAPPAFFPGGAPPSSALVPLLRALVFLDPTRGTFGPPGTAVPLPPFF